MFVEFVTRGFIEECQAIEESKKGFVASLLDDIDEYNKMVTSKGHHELRVELSVQVEHNEYSPERTDPCPDYYGMYRLHFEIDRSKTVGMEMDLDMLDNCLMHLNNLAEMLKGK